MGDKKRVITSNLMVLALIWKIKFILSKNIKNLVEHTKKGGNYCPKISMETMFMNTNSFLTCCKDSI